MFGARRSLHISFPTGRERVSAVGSGDQGASSKSSGAACLVLTCCGMRLTVLILLASAIACGAATPCAPRARAGTPSARPRLVLGVETACVLTPGSRAECEGSYATEIEALGEVRAMALGDDSGCAITVDARLWCWGGSAGSCHGGLPAELPAGSERMPAALVARCSPRPIELPAPV